MRYLSTLLTIANERTSTVMLPFPTDLGQRLGSGARFDGGAMQQPVA